MSRQGAPTRKWHMAARARRINELLFHTCWAALWCNVRAVGQRSPCLYCGKCFYKNGLRTLLPPECFLSVCLLLLCLP